MVNEELERARARLKEIGADWALLSSGENVTYVSHYEVPVEYGPAAHLSYVRPMALFGVNDSASFMLVSNFLIEAAKKQSTFDEVLHYNLIALFAPFEKRSPKDDFIELLRGTLKKARLGNGKARLAIEENSLPAIVVRLLADEFPNVELTEAGPALTAARMVKTEREIELLRFAAEVVNAGQKELINQCQKAGKNEYEMWAAITQAMHFKADRPLFVSGELVTGERCREIAPGGPVNYVTKPGDLALMDISPRVNGYWGDCTNILVIGGVEPTEKQKLYGVAAREAFYAAAEVLRPGRKASEAFGAAKGAFAKHGLEIGHYAGHQIGVTVNETPWLVPYDETPIQAGMVFCIETGSYEGLDGEIGARAEKTIIVRESGPEIIPDFEFGF